MKPQITVIILRTQHPDYEPPKCDPRCIKDAVLAHLDKVSIDLLMLTAISVYISQGWPCFCTTNRVNISISFNSLEYYII